MKRYVAGPDVGHREHAPQPFDPSNLAPGAPILRIVRAQDFGGEEMDAIPEEAVGAALKDLLKETAPAPSRSAKG